MIQYEIISLIYNRKTCRLDLLWFCMPKGYVSLSYLPLHCEVWSTNVSKYKLIRIGQRNQLIQVNQSFLYF